jgi:hypothetical protein
MIINSALKGVLFFLFFMLSLAVKGQDYVILASGEKVFGKGISPFDYNNYSIFKFSDRDGNRQHYKPEDLLRFQLENGRTFVTHTLKEESGPVFAQVIFSGKVSLYRYGGYYYLHHKDEMSLLKNQKQTQELNGKMMVLHQKPYVNVIKNTLSGPCGDRLFPEIKNLSLKEEELIAVLKDYHDCEGASYQVHVKDIPLFKISPIVAAGITSPFLTAYRTRENRRDFFENNQFPFFQAGVRFYDARKAPRFLFDLGVGYLMDDNVIHTEYIQNEVKIIGMERYKSSSFYIPLSANYILYRNTLGEIYGGGGVTIWFNRVESDYAMIEFTYFSDITLHADPYYSKRDNPYSVNAKLGANLFASKYYRIFAETKVDWFNDYYQLNLLKNVSRYNQISPSLSVGLQF